MSLRYSSILIFCIAWSVVGFPFLAALTSVLGVPSTEFSIAFRTLAAASAATLLLKWNSRFSHLALVLFTIFWLAYFLRLYVATLLDSEDLRRPEQLYWIWAFGACFLPALAVLIHSNRINFDKIYFWILSLSIATIILSLAKANTLLQGSGGNEFDINRLHLSSLNPISLGHLGITCALLGICGFISRDLVGRYYWMAVSAIGLGLSIAILANSRGPLLAFAVCVILLILGRARQLSTYMLIGILIVAAVFAFIFQLDVIFSENGVLSRFSDISSGDAASMGRLIAYQGALNQFLDSPIFGDAIEERVTGFYPHNVLLEAFMATGVVGGIPFTSFIILGLLCAWRLVRTSSQELWVGVLATQYFVGAMLSGAIYTSNTMWVLIAMVICSRINKGSKPQLTQVGRNEGNV